MAETKAKTAKPGFWHSLKEEFAKIIWPTKESVAKQTFAVVVISVILGLLIAMFDAIIQYGVNALIGLGA